MIKKTVKYHDYEGNEREDDFYFNLTQIELNKINSDPSLPGGIEECVNRAVKTNDAGEVLRILDGSFVKRNASGLPLYEAFVNTEAYDNLLTDLISGGENAVGEFLMGCLPVNAQARVREELNNRESTAKIGGAQPIHNGENIPV